jgi:hypothetical protein
MIESISKMSLNKSNVIRINREGALICLSHAVDRGKVLDRLDTPLLRGPRRDLHCSEPYYLVL